MNNCYLIIIALIIVIVCITLFAQREKFMFMKKKGTKIEEGYEDVEVENFAGEYDGPEHILLNELPIIQHSVPVTQVPDEFISDVDRRYNELEKSFYLPMEYSHHSMALPQVILKGKNSDYSLSTFIRGDIPIVINEHIPLIGKSRYGRESQNITGLFANTHIPGETVIRPAGQYGGEVWTSQPPF